MTLLDYNFFFKTPSLTMSFCLQVFDVAFPCASSADFLSMSECSPLFLTHDCFANALFSLRRSTSACTELFGFFTISSPSTSVLHAGNGSVMDDKFPFSILI